MKRKNMNAFLACLFLFSGCDIIDYHPYDVRIKGETDINAKNIEKIEQATALWQPWQRFLQSFC